MDFQADALSAQENSDERQKLPWRRQTRGNFILVRSMGEGKQFRPAGVDENCQHQHKRRTRINRIGEANLVK
jgi:hypothetical protein